MLSMKKLLYIFGLATLAACKPNLKPETPSAAGLDFSRYLAMGNSLTAGYADGSLYRSGQINSYPAILASQFGFFGKYEFRQPLLPGESGWPINTSSPNPMLWRTPKMVLGYTTDCQGNTGLGPTAFSGVPDTAGSSINIGTEGPFNNFGIPFIRTIDYLTPGYALGANALGGLPWALRMFANPFATPLQEALRLNPTFFTRP